MNLTRQMIYMGEDIVICVHGGISHIGGHVTAIPYQKKNEWHVTLNTFNLVSHKDDEIARLYAKALCEHTHHTVTCVCGIHYDEITGDQIKEIFSWVKQDIEEMIKEVCQYE